MSQRAWTMPEINRMAQMVADGLTRKQIATRLNRTLESVSRKATKLGLASKVPRYWSEIEDARLRKLVRDGLMLREITKQMGRTTSSIWNRMESIGLNARAERAMRRAA